MKTSSVLIAAVAIAFALGRPATAEDTTAARTSADAAIQRVREALDGALRSAETASPAATRRAERTALHQQRLLDIAGRELSHASSSLEAGDVKGTQQHARLASRLVTDATAPRSERGGRQ